ncbi:nuclear transport factor 2 family protein [Comamonas testosteroni]|uniref:nuclear transport factor 2 family protein n=1 Tax=Comamonas testosteroni TaxID=285 RepID=UPI0038998130
MTLQDISDKLEINELLAHYCYVLDQKDWEAFGTIFVSDAVLDFTAFGGPKGSPAERQDFFTLILNGLASTQHIVSIIKIDLAGDNAAAWSAAIVPMTAKAPDGKESTFASGLWYEDNLVQTHGGWKNNSQTQVRS